MSGHQPEYCKSPELGQDHYNHTTYYFITDSFKNWRGMKESGGRRIKRSIFINARTVKFVDRQL
jgi:hypothetical protein